MHEAKNSKICNFCTFWPLIQLINHLCWLLKRWHINRVIDQNIQKLLFLPHTQLVSLKVPTDQGFNFQSRIGQSWTYHPMSQEIENRAHLHTIWEQTHKDLFLDNNEHSLIQLHMIEFDSVYNLLTDRGSQISKLPMSFKQLIEFPR